MLTAVLLSLALVGIIIAGFYLFGAEVERFVNRVQGPAETPLSEAAKQLHATSFVMDLHADSLLFGRDLLVRGDRGHVDIPRLRDGGVALQVFTMVTQAPPQRSGDRSSAQWMDMVTLLALAQRWPAPALQSLRARALHQVKRFECFVREAQGTLVLVRNRIELEALLKARERDREIVGALLGIEGAHALERGLDDLELFFDNGVRLIGLAHFSDNAFAGSAHGIERGGLTPLGRALVDRMQQRGMIIDLAHASATTIEEVLDRVSVPVLVSHTGVRATLDSNRNLSDGQIRAIARNGGVVGIGYWKAAVGETSVAAIVRAMRHVIDLVGDEHVALGSDWDGAVDTPLDASGLGMITHALVAAGLPELSIRRILGENALRVFRSVLPVGGACA